MAEKIIYRFTEQSEKQFIKWKALKNLICCVFLFLIGLLPVATVEGISIGNYYELLIQKIEKVDSVQHLAPIVWIAIICLGIALIKFFLFLYSIIKKSSLPTPTMLVKKTFIDYIITLVIQGVLIFLSFLVCVFFARPYSFKIVTPVYMMIILAISEVLDYVFSDLAIKKLEIKKMEIVANEKEKNSIKVFFANIGTYLPIYLLIVVVFLCLPFGLDSLTSLIRSYDTTIYNSLHYEYFSIGKTGTPHTTLTIDEEKGVKIDWSSSSSTLSLKGEAYYYYQDKLAEMEKEFTSMMPESSSGKDIEKYTENMKNLAQKIEIISEVFENYSYSYEQLNFEFISETVEIPWFNPITFRDELKWVTENRKRAYEYIYDAAPNTENPVKWGEEYGFIEKLLYREKIELSESEFKVGTDFSETEIVATVQYGDGSIRISVIKPNNVEELNSAKAGKQVVKWSDSWGKYEATIELIS